MPNWLHNALAYSILTAFGLIVSIIEAVLILIFGLAWGLILGLAIALLIAWAASKLDYAGAFVAVPGWLGLIVGAVVGGVWRLLS